MGRGLSFPFQIGAHGTPRGADRDRLVRQQLEQLLFTLPGERVNRPDFGCGVQLLVFAGASRETAAAAEYRIRLSIQRELADLLVLDAVRVTADDATLHVDLLFTVRPSGERRAESFQRPLGAPP